MPLCQGDFSPGTIARDDACAGGGTSPPLADAGASNPPRRPLPSRPKPTENWRSITQTRLAPRSDLRTVGLGVMAFVQLGCAEHTEAATEEFQKIIQSSPNVLSCHNTTGEADFLLQVVAKDLDDYSRFVERVLRRLPGVSSIRSNISLRELKSSNRLPIPV